MVIVAGLINSKNMSSHRGRHLQDHGWLSVVHISKLPLSSWCWNSEDHGRLPDKHTNPSIHVLQLPDKHMAKHPHKTCIHVVDSLVHTAEENGAVGTSTRAVACAFASQPQPLLFVHIRPSRRSAAKKSPHRLWRRNLQQRSGPDSLGSALLALLGGPAIVVAVEQHDGVALLAVVLIDKVALPVDL